MKMSKNRFITKLPSQRNFITKIVPIIPETIPNEIPCKKVTPSAPEAQNPINPPTDVILSTVS